MRKQNQEIKDKNIIEKILSKSEICRIAMIDDGKPYLLPFNYGYKDNFIYIHSALVGRKIDILKKNNYVCFEIEYKADLVKYDDPCKWSTRYRSVIGYGTVEIITDTNEKKAGLDIIMAHNGKSGENIYQERQLDTLVILKLSIASISGKQSSNWNNQNNNS